MVYQVKLIANHSCWNWFLLRGKPVWNHSDVSIQLLWKRVKAVSNHRVCWKVQFSTANLKLLRERLLMDHFVPRSAVCSARCDLGSFKLLGWTLVITGTWNCLIHADLRCTSACSHQKSLCTRPARNLAQLLSTVEEFSFFGFFFCCCYFAFLNVTYCAMWWITQTAALSDLLPHANEKHMFSFLFF